ncbi:MAG: Putative integral membrane zinc-metalloprotease [uncultured Sulfurovum sp.]|uniref:Integral membrane zinc-metalloprotease n=1 Tax=uncultured Sulfurovum sp. TaxID=269237 RepID=A0A6S6TG64_9BACT|nr:MAG: Putative integral membrane zinc-metalloprotease [uncultured Sulfurovum sp.]
MLEIIMVLFTIYTFLKLYISVMQIGYISQEKNREAVLMSQDKYFVAGTYAIKKERLGMISTLVDYAMFVWWITVGFAWLAGALQTDNSVVEAVAFLFGFIAVGFVVGLPFELYQTFKLDKEYGFSKTTPKLYMIDQVKSTIMFLIFGGAVFYALSWIVINISSWWLWGFALLFGIALLINVIYPTIIAPIFNKFTPLEEGELKTDIESMMQGVGLKSDGVFVLDASKRDSRLNAYFGGLGKSKRVVLFDTLMEKLTNKELLAVLGHELGHFSHGDIWKNIGMMGVLLFSSFFILGNLSDTLFTEMHVAKTAGVEIAMMMLLLPLLSFIFTPILSAVSRHNEYAADEFGSALGGKANLVSALMKLVEENKAFPKSHPLFAFFYYTHPPVLERLKELGYDAHAVNEGLKKEGIFTFFENDKPN